MDLLRVNEYIKKEAENKHFTIGVYADLLGSPEFKIEINSQRIFPIASLFKVNLLIHACKKIVEESLNLTDRVSIKRHHICPGAMLSRFDIGTEITINNLLQFMIERSDNTATDMLGELLDWKKTVELMPLWGITETKWLMPTKLQMMLGCDLLEDFKKKTLHEKRNFGISRYYFPALRLFLIYAVTSCIFRKQRCD